MKTNEVEQKAQLAVWASGDAEKIINESEQQVIQMYACFQGKGEEWGESTFKPDPKDAAVLVLAIMQCQVAAELRLARWNYEEKHGIE